MHTRSAAHDVVLAIAVIVFFVVVTVLGKNTDIEALLRGVGMSDVSAVSGCLDDIHLWAHRAYG